MNVILTKKQILILFKKCSVIELNSWWKVFDFYLDDCGSPNYSRLIEKFFNLNECCDEWCLFYDSGCKAKNKFIVQILKDKRFLITKNSE